MKKDKEYKKLRKDVLTFLKSKRRSLYVGANKKSFSFLKYFMLFLCIRASFALFNAEQPTNDLYFKLVPQIIGTFIYFVAFSIIGSEPPKKNEEEWLWKNGQRTLILLPLAGVTLLIPLFSYLEFNSINRISAIVGVSFIAIISGLTFFIGNNPKYFLSSFLTGFGTTLVIIAPMAIPFLFLKRPPTTMTWVIFPLLHMICFTWSYNIYRRNLADKSFNLIQNSVLRFLRPRQIILALPPKIRTALKAERKALKIETELEKNEEYDVELYLLQRLKEKYPDRSSYTKGIISAIAVFLILGIISSLIEFITQDVIYVPYLQEIVCKVFECKE